MDVTEHEIIESSVSKIGMTKMDITDNTLSKQFTVKSLKFNTTSKMKVSNEDENENEMSRFNNKYNNGNDSSKKSVNNFDILEKVEKNEKNGELAVNYKVNYNKIIKNQIDVNVIYYLL